MFPTGFHMIESFCQCSAASETLCRRSGASQGLFKSSGAFEVFCQSTEVFQKMPVELNRNSIPQ